MSEAPFKCPFKIGDRVEVVTNHRIGVIRGLHGDDAISALVWVDHSDDTKHYQRSYETYSACMLKLVEA